MSKTKRETPGTHHTPPGDFFSTTPSRSREPSQNFDLGEVEKKKIRKTSKIRSEFENNRVKFRYGLVVCRCGKNSETVDNSIYHDRYRDFILPHWKTCRKDADIRITDCFKWEKPL